MKLKIFNKSGESQSVECESFEFDNGFLKLVQPAGESSTELYISLGTITMLENFGPKREPLKETKKNK